MAAVVTRCGGRPQRSFSLQPFFNFDSFHVGGGSQQQLQRHSAPAAAAAPAPLQLQQQRSSFTYTQRTRPPYYPFLRQPRPAQNVPIATTIPNVPSIASYVPSAPSVEPAPLVKPAPPVEMAHMADPAPLSVPNVKSVVDIRTGDPNGGSDRPTMHMRIVMGSSSAAAPDAAADAAPSVPQEAETGGDHMMTMKEAVKMAMVRLAELEGLNHEMEEELVVLEPVAKGPVISVDSEPSEEPGMTIVDFRDSQPKILAPVVNSP